MGDEVKDTDPNQRYIRFDDILGRGAYKVVYRAIDRDLGIEVAWNQISIDQKADFDKLWKEITILRSLSHPNILLCHAAWVDIKQLHVAFITECMTSGTLRQFITKAKKVKLKVLKNWCVQILEGLNYLHTREPPIIHRDIKCDNLFINGSMGVVKIGDLGLATNIISFTGNKLSVIGTPEFMAPEYYEENYNEKVDIWAFGMCLLEMATLEYPFSECSNPAQIFKKVSTGCKPRALAKIKDMNTCNFISECLKMVSTRKSAFELLQHPFLQNIDQDDNCDLELRTEAEADEWIQSMENCPTNNSSLIPSGIFISNQEPIKKSGSLEYPLDGSNPLVEIKADHREDSPIQLDSLIMETINQEQTTSNPIDIPSCLSQVPPSNEFIYSILSKSMTIPRYNVVQESILEDQVSFERASSYARNISDIDPVHSTVHLHFPNSHIDDLTNYQYIDNSNLQPQPTKLDHHHQHDYHSRTPSFTSKISPIDLNSHSTRMDITVLSTPQLHDMICLNLQLSLGTNPDETIIEFDYHINEDTPIHVAAEMVRELHLPESNIEQISELIKAKVNEYIHFVQEGTLHTDTGIEWISQIPSICQDREAEGREDLIDKEYPYEDSGGCCGYSKEEGGSGYSKEEGSSGYSKEEGNIGYFNEGGQNIHPSTIYHQCFPHLVNNAISSQQTQSSISQSINQTNSQSIMGLASEKHKTNPNAPLQVLFQSQSSKKISHNTPPTLQTTSSSAINLTSCHPFQTNPTQQATVTSVVIPQRMPLTSSLISANTATSNLQNNIPLKSFSSQPQPTLTPFQSNPTNLTHAIQIATGHVPVVLIDQTLTPMENSGIISQSTNHMTIQNSSANSNPSSTTTSSATMVTAATSTTSANPLDKNLYRTSINYNQPNLGHIHSTSSFVENSTAITMPHPSINNVATTTHIPALAISNNNANVSLGSSTSLNYRKTSTKSPLSELDTSLIRTDGKATPRTEGENEIINSNKILLENQAELQELRTAAKVNAANFDAALRAFDQTTIK